MTTSDTWFAVDRKGLGELLERKGKGFAVLELIQNALDEDTTLVEVSIEPCSDRLRGRHVLRVTDDSPDGFKDLTHAYTLFAPSAKKGDAEKRGRFNLGEKLVLALCDEAHITSTKGGIHFDADGTRKSVRQSRPAGTIFSAVIRMTQKEACEAISLAHQVVVPEGKTLIVNDVKVERREPVKTFVATLATEVADDEGRLRPTRRQTSVSLYEPADDETPHLYEMGIPVVEHDGRWHVDVGQKIPLNMDRDNVTPAYLRAIRVAVLENTSDLITAEDANSTWVKDALPQASPEVAAKVFVERFGEKTVVYDPSDTEANKRAQDAGYTVIYGRSLSAEEHAKLRETEVFKPAGKVMPSGVIFDPSEGPSLLVPEADWTAQMRNVARYAVSLAKALDVVDDLSVLFYRHNQKGQKRWAAAWSDGTHALSISLREFGTLSGVEHVDDILLHEFAHHYGSDHFSDRFIDATTRLGASFVGLARRGASPTLEVA